MEPGEKFVGIRSPAGKGFRVQVRSRSDSNAHRFDQVQQLPPADLPSLGWSEQKRFAFRDAVLTFTESSALNGLPIENFVPSIELTDLQLRNEADLVIERRPRFLVQSCENQMRPRLPVGFGVGQEMNAAVGVCAELVTRQ